MRLHFRLRWIPLVATLMVAGIGIALGNWQTRRADEKIAMAEAIAARSQQTPLSLKDLPENAVPEEFRSIALDGNFVGDWPIYLDNRPLNGKAGFYLLMPLRVSGSERVVLVQRGWFQRDPQDRQRLPSIPVPQGEVKVTGRVRASVGKLMQLGETPLLTPGMIAQNVSIEALSAASKIPLQNFIIEQTNDLGDGLVRDWPLPSAGVDTHRAYAFQWYALSAAAFLFFIVTGFRRARTPNA